MSSMFARPQGHTQCVLVRNSECTHNFRLQLHGALVGWFSLVLSVFGQLSCHLEISNVN